VYFGDGHAANTTSAVTYTYPTPGRYLVAVQEFVNGQPLSSTFNALQTIQVTPTVSESIGPLISIPVVSFDVNRNPSAPVVRVGEDVYLSGGFLEPPSGANMIVSQYVWDFGNGATKTLAANSTSYRPAQNPAVSTYDRPGLFAVILTLVTENSTSMATYKTSVAQTVAVGSTSQNYAIFLYAGSVPNPSVINVAQWTGGSVPYSFDPAVESSVGLFGWEVVGNIFSTLLAYNGSSTTDFIPMAATQVPSLSNGQISSDYMTYTFQIRPNLRFSNGDPLTAYDVWYSTIRTTLFVGGVPATGDWVLVQYLVPGANAGVPIMADTEDIAHYKAIVNAVTYSYSSNTVTFRLVRPLIPQRFFEAIASYPGILDSRWLQQVGAGITFTPAGFYAYQSQGNAGGYNLKVQYIPVASGPYAIQNYAVGQSITLVPNPGFPGVPGIPVVHNTVVIQYAMEAHTAYELWRSCQADIVTWIIGSGSPNDIYLPLLKQQVANGQAALYQFPMLAPQFYPFNIDINETAMKTVFGAQYHVPHDYFANLKVRKAFAYAFNYTRYYDEIQGNRKYGVNLGDPYAGALVPGEPYHVPVGELQNVPMYNLTYAKELLQESGEYDIPVTIPFVAWTGDVIDQMAGEMWAAALHSIDPNIVMTPVYVPYLTLLVDYGIPGFPTPIYYGVWTANYPYPSDPVAGVYKQGGHYTAVDGWSVDLNSTGHGDQAAMYAEMNSLIAEADSTTNATLAAQDYKQVEQIAIDLYMYVYTSVFSQFWAVKSYMTGYQGQISDQMNPLFGGIEDGHYYWWVKGCENPQACAGRNIGP
jgi:ABC-type transport system substrate-binding protein